MAETTKPRIEVGRYGKFIAHGRDYEPWERGLEHVQQEGTSAWQEIRERYGLTSEDVEWISCGAEPGATYSTSGPVLWEEVRLAEDRPGLPDFNYIYFLAWIEGKSPGQLLDEVLIKIGTELAEGDDDG